MPIHVSVHYICMYTLVAELVNAIYRQTMSRRTTFIYLGACCPQFSSNSYLAPCNSLLDRKVLGMNISSFPNGIPSSRCSGQISSSFNPSNDPCQQAYCSSQKGSRRLHQNAPNPDPSLLHATLTGASSLILS